jgi:hypothetical protein
MFVANNLGQWESVRLNEVPNYLIKKQHMNILSNTWDRQTLKTISNFSAGTYTWYVSIITLGVKLSIGTLYHSDQHEIIPILYSINYIMLFSHDAKI